MTRLACWLVACLAAAPAGAQQHLANATVETRRLAGGPGAAGDLAQEVARVAARGAAAWVGYRVPVSAGGLGLCDAPAHLEPATELLVLARVEAGGISRLRLSTPDCEIDAGGLPLVWLEGVDPDASVAWLDQLARARGDDAAWRGRVARPALTALGMHATPAASSALIAIARAGSPTWLRREAVQWLARSKEPRATRFFEEILRH